MVRAFCRCRSPRRETRAATWTALSLALLAAGTATGCLSPWAPPAESGSAVPAGALTLVPGGCYAASLSGLPGPLMFWEARWKAAAQRLAVRLVGTPGGTCTELLGGARYDGNAARLVLFYDEPAAGAGCADAASRCGDAFATVVELQLDATGLALPSLVQLDLTRGAAAPDYANVAFTGQSFCTTGDSRHELAALTDVRLSPEGAAPPALVARVVLPGPAACYDVGHLQQNLADRVVVWPQITTLPAHCGCAGAAEEVELRMELGTLQPQLTTIQVAGRSPGEDAYRLFTVTR